MKVGDYIRTYSNAQLFYARILKLNRVNALVRTEAGDVRFVTKDFARTNLVREIEWHPEISNARPRKSK